MKNKKNTKTESCEQNKYEDFEKVAQRLRSKGKLNEENYAKIKSNNKKYFVSLLPIFLFVSFISIYSGNWFLILILVVILLIVPVGFKSSQNKLCYIFTYGVEGRGEIINIEKDFKQAFLGNLILTMNIKSCFEYKVAYKFKTRKSGTVTSVYRDPSHILSLKPLSSYVLGQEVIVYYDENNPEDSLILLPQFQYFNLLSKA